MMTIDKTKFNINKTKSPIKWVGGKSWLSPKIWDIYKNYQDRRFVEVFAGGLGLSFQLQPGRVLANDLNFQLINFYDNLQTNPFFSLDMNNEEKNYYKNRARFNELILDDDYSQESAELFYFLNRCGFNGLYRVNSKGLFNSPFGHYQYSNAVNDLSEYSNIIKNWEFTNEHFIYFLNKNIKESDFLFLDPPYFDVDFNSYQKNSFNWEDQVALIVVLEKLKNPIIITNQYSKEIYDLYVSAGFDVEFTNRPRNFRGGKLQTQEEKREILATKNLVRS